MAFKLKSPLHDSIPYYSGSSDKFGTLQNQRLEKIFKSEGGSKKVFRDSAGSYYPSEYFNPTKNSYGVIKGVTLKDGYSYNDKGLLTSSNSTKTNTTKPVKRESLVKTVNNNLNKEPSEKGMNTPAGGEGNVQRQEGWGNMNNITLGHGDKKASGSYNLQKGKNNTVNGSFKATSGDEKMPIKKSPKPENKSGNAGSGTGAGSGSGSDKVKSSSKLNKSSNTDRSQKPNLNNSDDGTGRNLKIKGFDIKLDVAPMTKFDFSVNNARSADHNIIGSRPMSKRDRIKRRQGIRTENKRERVGNQIERIKGRQARKGISIAKKDQKRSDEYVNKGYSSVVDAKPNKSNSSSPSSSPSSGFKDLATVSGPKKQPATVSGPKTQSAKTEEFQKTTSISKKQLNKKIKNSSDGTVKDAKVENNAKEYLTNNPTKKKSTSRYL